MNTEENLNLSKIERQVGTLKLAVLILGAALIYNSANNSKYTLLYFNSYFHT